MSRGRAGAIAAVAVVLLAVAAGTILLSQRHTAAPPLALRASPSPTTLAAADVVGTWNVDQGSEVGYRVKERFVGQPSDSEAVARTSNVSGQLVVIAAGAGLQLQAASFSADLRQLKSQDANATHGNAVRDSFVGRIYLESTVYPQATYQARLGPLGSATLPADLSLPGTFTVHGVTHDMTIPMRVTQNGSRLEVISTFPLHYGDYRIEVPQVPFTTAGPDATIEVHLFLKRQA
jgi:polyisoprenoid-binding protein YceI